MNAPHITIEPSILYFRTPFASQSIWVPRALECPVQMDAVLSARHNMMEDDSNLRGFISANELRITRVHVHPRILLQGHTNRVNADKSKPLILSFQKLYGLTDAEALPPYLAQINESSYRDVTPL